MTGIDGRRPRRASDRADMVGDVSRATAARDGWSDPDAP